MNYDLPKDPVILLGTINMKLRDFYDDLTALCDDLNIDYDMISKVLGDAGYYYDEPTNQFHKI